ncbi:ThuA domain-containing protein [Halioglobus pacificus]|uniref:ThuA domain-containing protein n=1 Tax=Parahalioglobus pacificus TaxID=930806 RepID=UPI001E57C650|nr:ThuA domain-containing protein [Halioglobus pacificus]
MAKSSFVWRLFRALLILGAVLLGLIAFALWYMGIWSVIFPSTHHDTRPPELPAAVGSPAVLVFSKTNQFRHTESIERGTEVLSSIAQRREWGYVHTENGAVFNAEQLQRFDVVVFLNATGDMLSDEQEMAFQNWVEAGGGWFGIHAAGDGSHTGWRWYMEQLLGALFTAHILGPQFQVATVITEDGLHPLAEGLPAAWEHNEEWYSWEQSPRGSGFHVIATVDEGTYTPLQNFMGQSRDLSMGDHPIYWARCVGKGRAVYSALGHNADAYDNPPMRQLLDNALRWAINGEGQACDL